MKTARHTLVHVALVSIIATTLLTGCITDGFEDSSFIETSDGAIVVDRFTMTATVQAIDAGKRKLTLVTTGGSKSTYKAVPEIVNFDLIQVGDQVRATVTDEVAIFIGRGAPPSAMAAVGVALAPAGGKPAGVLVDTEQITAKITAVDATKHKVTFQLPDGTTKMVKAGNTVDLSTVRPGDDVNMQVSEGLVIAVVKP